MTRPVCVQGDDWDSDIKHTRHPSDNDNDTDSYLDGYSSDDKYDFKFKICMLGECGVGKTSLIKRFISNKFNDGNFYDDENNNRTTSPDDDFNFNTTKPTIGVDCMRTVRVMRGHKIAIEIWDTAGQGNFLI
jgi:GTPase SAR1 family protein